MLARPELEQLAQRVIARFHLEALSPAESEKYIAHRLSVAGMTGTLPFNREARARIHALSRGIPRRINLLADRSLLGAYASGKSRVDREIVDKAAVEVFGTLGLPEAGRSAPERRVVVAAAALAGVALAGVIGAAAVGALQRPGAGTTLAGAAAASAPKTAASAASAAASSATTALAKAVPPAASAASAPSTPSAPSDAIAVTPATDPAELRNALGAAARNERDAWRELAQSWGVNIADGEPCQLAARQRLQCFRGSGSLASLRQLDRPAILTLRGENDEPLYALMTGLGPHGAVLQTSTARRSVSLLTLAQMWRGEFATLWRAPEGYRASAGEDGGSAASQWVSARLTSLQGSPRTGDAEVPLKSRISAFQMAQGLKPDGLAGPMTYMQLNRVSGVDEPKLQAQK